MIDPRGPVGTYYITKNPYPQACGSIVVMAGFPSLRAAQAWAEHNYRNSYGEVEEYSVMLRKPFSSKEGEEGSDEYYGNSDDENVY